MALKYPEQQIPGLKQSVSLSISTAADGLGDVLDTKGLTLTGIALSTVWTSAGITFKVGNSTSAMYSLFNSTNSEFLLTCTSSQVHYISPDVFSGFQYIQPRSGIQGTVVAQTTATTITAFLAPVGRNLPR